MFLMILPNYDIEDELVRRLRQHDKTALNDIYEKYFSPIYHYIRLKINNAQAAEDLAADVFLALIEAVSKNKAPRISLRGWLFKVARNHIAQYHQSTQRINALNLDDWIVEDSTNLENLVIKNANFGRVVEAIHSLPEEQQDVIIFRFGQSLNLKETADIMGKGVGAVKSLQFRAIEALRQVLQVEQ